MSGGPSVRAGDERVEAELVADAVRLGPVLRIDDIDLDESDFHTSAKIVWRVLVRRHEAGRPISPQTVRSECIDLGLEGERFDRIMATASEVPTVAGVEEAARRVRSMAVRLEVGRVLADAMEAHRRGTPPSAVVDRAMTSLGSIDLGYGLEDVPMSLGEFPAEDDDKPRWLFEGSIQRQERVLFVGPPGLGKSMFTTQLAVCCAVGFDPFRLTPVEPGRALIVNGENRPAYGRNQVRQVLERLRRAGIDTSGTEDRLFTVFETEGIDIRAGQDFTRLQRWLRHAQPDLLVIGPLYAVGVERRGREDYAQAAAEFRRRINFVAERFDCAVVMEHHGSKADEYTPSDSHVLQRWPDMGMSLIPLEGRTDQLKLKAFRPPRGRRWAMRSGIRYPKAGASVTTWAGPDVPARSEPLMWMPCDIEDPVDEPAGPPRRRRR